jgi:hypothetical protein
MIEKWQCFGCGIKWEILCEELTAQGPSQIGGCDFRCPTRRCGRRLLGDPKEFEAAIPGLPTSPLKYREEGNSEWHEITDS